MCDRVPVERKHKSRRETHTTKITFEDESVETSTTILYTIEAIRLARELGYGVTGNFVVDPDWDAAEFERLLSFMEKHQLNRVGFTLLTPLPGTPFYGFDQAFLYYVCSVIHYILWLFTIRVTSKTLSRNVVNPLFSVFCLGGGFIVAAIAVHVGIRTAVTVCTYTTCVTVVDREGVTLYTDISPIFCVMAL